jgi:hypothetical protein
VILLAFVAVLILLQAYVFQGMVPQEVALLGLNG